MTRKLTIRTKLAATLAVPLAVLAVFAALQERRSHNGADEAKLQAEVVMTANGPSGVVDALLNERDFEALRVVGLDKRATWLKVKSSRQAEDGTDNKLSSFSKNLRALSTDSDGTLAAVIKHVGDQLEGLRTQAEDLASQTSTANAKRAAGLYDSYTSLIADVLDADQQLAAGINDAQMRTGVELLNALSRQNDIESRIVIKSALANISSDAAQAAQAQGLAVIQAEGERNLKVRADGIYAHPVSVVLGAPARRKAIGDLHNVANDPAGVKLETVLAIPKGAELLHSAESSVSNAVNARSSALADAAQNSSRDWTGVMIGSVLLAVVLLWLTNRWITRPLRMLADQASTMAGTRLPTAVDEILSTPAGRDVQRPDVDPVRVRAGGEVRDVVNALNRVQDSAIQLAVDQARLRGNVADAFVNLGRRNQNLLSRQLEFITQLETEESDPETLEHLFRLDHLATRMRRNAESLLVLAGHEPPRTWSAPVDVLDVVRGALGEVEGYQRVRLRHVDEARVDGGAAVDVSHVIAELLENALSFSSPDSDVEVFGRSDERGYVVTIIDQGIGMPAEDLERANALISAVDARGFAPSRFLGHYVVAQLAARHDLQVGLSASPAGGLTATVVLPAAVMGMQPPRLEIAPESDEATTDEAPIAPLPRRGNPQHLVERVDAATPAESTVVDMWAALAAVPDPEPEPEAQPVFAPGPESIAEQQPAPVRATAPPLDWQPETRGADAPAPEPQPVPESQPRPEPAPAPRPPLGVGSFADLLAPAPVHAAAPAPAPMAAPLGAESDAAGSPFVPDDAPAPVGPSRAGALAELAHAVDAVDAVVASGPEPVADVPASVFSEDLLPQKLPKRGRRASRLASPWSRDKKPRPATESAPVAPAVRPLVADTMPPGTEPATSVPGPVHFPRGGPDFVAAGTAEQGPASPPSEQSMPSASAPAASTDEDRFAFFAAFRAAAEQAREEAGIDNRRIGQ